MTQDEHKYPANVIVIEESRLKELASEAARETLAAYNNVIDEEFDSRYTDVSLLMRNYRKLKTHYANVDPETLEVDAICNMKRKTGLMMSHVEKMVSAYETICIESGSEEECRRWKAMWLRFIDPDCLCVDEIAQVLHVDKRTFYRDVNRALEDMAVLLFGIESLGTWKHRNRPKVS